MMENNRKGMKEWRRKCKKYRTNVCVVLLHMVLSEAAAW